MRLKSFYAPTLSEAIAEVKRVLGKEAIIVATHEDKESKLVRITAAIDESSIYSNHENYDNTPSKETQSPLLSPELLKGTDVIEVLAEALTRENVPFELSEHLLAIATQVLSDDAHVCLSKAISSIGNFAIFNADKPSMIVGPMGAGKTLCIAKMATQAVLMERSATVVSMDNERAGSNAQLEAFTDVLQTKFLKIHDAQALKDLLSEKYSNAALYADTSSVNIFDVSEKKYVKSLIDAFKDSYRNSRHSANVFLAIPAFMDALIAKEVIQEFQSIGAMGVIITGVDLLYQRGNLLKLVTSSSLECCMYSNTRKVTEKLEPLTSEKVADFILRRKRR